MPKITTLPESTLSTDQDLLVVVQNDITKQITTGLVLQPISAEIATIQSDVITIQNNIVTIQSDITSIQSDVTTIQSDVTTIQSDITTLSNEIIKKDGSVDMNTGYTPNNNTSVATKEYVDNNVGNTNAIISDISQGGAGSQIVPNIVKITSADYNLLTPDADTLYIIL